MLEFLVDNIFVVFAGKVFQQIIGIPMGANCAHLLADKFLIWSRINTVFALNTKETVGISVQLFVHKQPRVWEWSGSDVSRWTWKQRHEKGNTSASYLDLLLSVGRDGQLHTSIYDKSDDFNFHITNISITNFPFPSSIYQPRPPMLSLSHSLYDMPGFAPRMDVLFWGQRDFQISFTNRDHAGHTRKAPRISKAAVDNCGKGVGSFYLS